MNHKKYGILIALLATIWLQGCSWLDFFEDSGRSFKEPSELRVQARWFSPDLPAEALSLSPDSKTITGQCTFQPELLSLLPSNPRGILLPMMAFGEEGQVTLDPVASKPVYKALQSTWLLGSPHDSLQLYQRWVSSVEYSCPDGLGRELSRCDMKPFHSLGGILGSESNYDLDRINNWLIKQESLRYLILPDLELLKSEAVLQFRYSPNSPVITRPAEPDFTQVTPFMLRQTLDWVLLDESSRLISEEFISYGHCSVTWYELEGLMASGENVELSFDQLNKVNMILNQEVAELLKRLSFQIGIEYK
ncbi:hypothetical protein [Endozoicomonas sp.]|uniref:hypothetical protein n=1 Tax=Endozoicomonas sp. TaxID=1892382 RepID=UPI002886A3ED|nr:hypothetical protein [Endozoicomonas sp.]